MILIFYLSFRGKYCNLMIVNMWSSYSHGECFFLLGDKFADADLSIEDSFSPFVSDDHTFLRLNESNNCRALLQKA